MHVHVLRQLLLLLLFLLSTRHISGCCCCHCGLPSCSPLTRLRQPETPNTFRSRILSTLSQSRSPSPSASQPQLQLLPAAATATATAIVCGPSRSLEQSLKLKCCCAATILWPPPTPATTTMPQKGGLAQGHDGGRGVWQLNFLCAARRDFSALPKLMLQQQWLQQIAAGCQKKVAPACCACGSKVTVWQGEI